MATFVFYADAGHKRRPDGRNTVVAVGADEASARAAAEALVGEAGALAEFRAVQLGDAVPAFVVEGHPPIGARGQATWPHLTRGGGFLPGA